MGTKISELNIQTPADGTEYVECIIPPYTAGTNRRITTQDIANLAGGGGAVDSVNGQTGVVVLTKTDVGLGNADNTSDVNKPVSTAQQTALDLKAPLASPTFTGIPAAPTAAAGTSTTQVATTAFVNQSKYVFYVNDYGAVANSNGTSGNGTDNTTAITNAINAAISAGGGTVRLGNGIYRCSSVLIFGTVGSPNHNITIEGNGMGSSMLFIDNTATDDARLRIVGNGIHHRNYTLQSRFTFSNAAVGIQIVGDRCSIENVEVKDSNSFAILVGTGSDDVTIKGCVVRRSAADGIHVNGGSTRVKVINNFVSYCADDAIGIGFESATNQVDIIGNTTFQTATGVSIMGYSTSGVTPDVRNINVIGNNISDTWLSGIFLHITQGSLEQVTIDGNTIRNAGGFAPESGLLMRAIGIAGGITVQAASSNTSFTMRDIVINNNNIKGVRNSFIDIGFVTAILPTIGQLRDIKISNNVCEGYLGAGGVGSWGFGAVGESETPVDTTYPGIAIKNILGGLDVTNNQVRNPRGSVITVASTVQGFARCRENSGAQGNGSTTATYAYNFLPTGSSATFMDIGNNYYPISSDYTTGITNIATGTALMEFDPGQESRRVVSGTTYTVVTADTKKILGFTSTSARTVTMPAATQMPVGKVFWIVDEGGNAGTNNITINRVGAETIDGATSAVINTNYGKLGFYTNGTNWFTIQ